MFRDPKFDDIRPYYDEEIPAAMQRIVSNETFPLLASYVYPDEDIEVVRKRMLGYKKVEDFQYEVMIQVNRRIIENSITSFTYSGIENLNTDQKYLFVSNHRDIMLDASLLGYILYLNKHQSPEITFGANLMKPQVVVDIGKSNKMFKVERGGNAKEFYRSCLHCSEYIRHVITEKKQSVWIAQRNGRTKDGNDLTDQAIVKMFSMSCPQDKIAALADLNIVPVSVSYEWEPCDLLKAIELYQSRFTQYIKKPGEDLNSILTGITQPKGSVHFEIGKPITREELMQYNDCTNGEYHKQVVCLLDKAIRSNYKLSANNYIAHDLQYGQRKYSEMYTPEQEKAFIERLDKLQNFEIAEMDVLRDIFLGIYANPVNCNNE